MSPSLTMTPSLRYAATGAVGIGLIAAALWPALDPAGRTGVLLAAAIAVPVQSVAFAVLRRFRREREAFLMVWLGGTLVRIAAIGVVAFVVIGSGMDGAVPMLLALAGFFFGLLLLEPVFFRSEPSTLADADGVEA